MIPPGSLVSLRLPSALIAGTVVVLTGLLARELGAGRGGQLLAAGCMACSGGTLAVTHTLSTTIVDLLVWTVLSYLVVRLLRGGHPQLWLAVGAVLGVGLENKWLVAFYAVGLLVSVAIVGPRQVLRSPWLWAGALLAALIWATGLWQLLHSPGLRPWRAFGVIFVLLAAVFIATGGKQYYLLGCYPVLAINPDAGETVGWPALASEVAQVQRTAPAGTVLLMHQLRRGRRARPVRTRAGAAVGIQRSQRVRPVGSAS